MDHGAGEPDEDQENREGVRREFAVGGGWDALSVSSMGEGQGVDGTYSIVRRDICDIFVAGKVKSAFTKYTVFALTERC